MRLGACELHTALPPTEGVFPAYEPPAYVLVATDAQANVIAAATGRTASVGWSNKDGVAIPPPSRHAEGDVWGVRVYMDAETYARLRDFSCISYGTWVTAFVPVCV